MRAPGMTLSGCGVRVDDDGRRVPHAVRMPIVTAALMMVYLDRNFGTNFFNAAMHG